jgi:glyoxylase-like metal-dependent hydrolase (beta-lactamase superfamily II)
MVPAPNRRDFLHILLGGATGLTLSTRAFGQEHALKDAVGSSPEHGRDNGPIITTRLSDNLLHVSGAGGNVVVVTGPEGLVMVNGGLRERSADLMAAIANETARQRVTALFNTDWHPEHTGSNETLGRTSAKIIAHEHTKQYLGIELFVEWQNRSYKALPPQALPNETFYTSGKMMVGRERVEYGHLGQAHTDGDIYVSFPDSNVLVAGDVMTVGKYPISDYTTGGWLGGLLTATKTLLELANADTRVIPGVGPVQTRADLQAQHDMLATMRDRLAKMMKQGMGSQDMLAAGATKEFDEKWGDPRLFVSSAYRGLWLHVRELGGIV